MKTTTVAFAIVAAALTSGCVTVITRTDTPRETIRFSSAEAAQVFYDAYLAEADPKSNSVTVAIALPYQRQEIKTDNVRFNAAASRADLNHDRIITRSEAGAFAKKVRSGA